ncbi:Kinesin-like protein KIN-7H [Euphorbia peplus]|nr:Kinesin-like protein KIN-7H [Euphorbia peplus]
MGAVDEENMAQQSSGEDKILVSVRLRPLNDKELARNDVSDWECINHNTVIYRNNLSVSDRSMYPTAYVFDQVFRPDCATRQVYESGAKEVALSVVNGINSSIFAYGQTSSGKTYTMSGITEYTVADIYDYLDKHKEREFVLKFSAMEIYNESVRDLLSTDTTPLRLLDDPEKGTVVERLTEETLRDWNHFKELLLECEAQRQIGETSMNEASSRSHQILRLTIDSSAREFLGNDKSSTLTATVNFVDLAGSERASQSMSAGMRLKEGCHINRSLLTLGTVIRKLSKGRNGHVPFRDSKLTRILQSSLGGNAKTAIICTISPARSHVENSRNTLLFASCAKEVTTNARVNVVVSDKALVKQLQRELARLESEKRTIGSNSDNSDLTALLKEKDLQIEKLLKEIADLNQQLDLAHSQIEHMLREAEDDRSSIISVEQEHHYPQLRVRSSFKSENSISYSPSVEDPRFLDYSIRSFNTSQFSAGDNSSISGTSVHTTDFDENYVQTTFSQELPNSTNFSPEPPNSTNFSPELPNSNENLNLVGDVLHVSDSKVQTEVDSCKEVQCIRETGSSAHSTSNSQISEIGPQTYEDSNTNTCKSGLTEVENEDTGTTELRTPPTEEQTELSLLNYDFIVPSPEKPSPWVPDVMSRSRSFKMIRSRSCRARLLNSPVSSPVRFENIEKNKGLPPTGLKKDYASEFEGSQPILSLTNEASDGDKSARRSSSSVSICSDGDKSARRSSVSMCSDGDKSARRSSVSMCSDEYQLQIISSPIDLHITSSVGDLDAGMKHLVDAHLEQETRSKAIDYPRNMKNVGLDPMEVDLETSSSNWPVEFKRLQQQIIELWQACSVSLIHRTYFFLLFNGDPSDSFYMEVEVRKLTFLRDTFFKGNETMVDGRVLSLTSSKKALNEERQMLCRQIEKRLSREERENLFLKWGIPLNAGNRRMQVVHRLWTKTADMDHILESATLIAKLVGFEGQEQTLKNMFGLLNFTPQHPKRKASLWKRSVLFRL